MGAGQNLGAGWGISVVFALEEQFDFLLAEWGLWLRS